MRRVDRIIILLPLLFLCLSTFGQQQNPQWESVPTYRIIIFKSWGLPIFDDLNRSECKTKVQQIMGFSYEVVAGCVVTQKDVKKWSRHNKKANKIMSKRYGKDWEEQYEAKWKECIN